MPPAALPIQRPEHITVCICTYRRVPLLGRLLRRLAEQRRDGFSFSIVVVDNDAAGSARSLVAETARSAGVEVAYDIEPELNIALARNRAVGHARGDYIALIDDDELPEDDWLLVLRAALIRYAADGILGPVLPDFEAPPPQWIVRSRIHEKRGPGTGEVLRWQDTRTSNALLRRALFQRPEDRFRSEFAKGGEDVDFFARAIARGCRFVWCDEAPVHESIPVERCRRAYVLRRALLRGQGTVRYQNFGPRFLVKSMLAVPGYTVALPFALLLGQHRFMQLLAKDAEHLGRLAAAAGYEPVKSY